MNKIHLSTKKNRGRHPLTPNKELRPWISLGAATWDPYRGPQAGPEGGPEQVIYATAPLFPNPIGLQLFPTDTLVVAPRKLLDDILITLAKCFGLWSRLLECAF